MKRFASILTLFLSIAVNAQDYFVGVRNGLASDNEFTIRGLDSCIRTGFQRDSALYYRSLVCLKYGDYKMALNDIARLQHDFSSFNSIDYLYALYYFSVQDYGRSAKKLNQVLKQDPHNTKALYNRALVAGMMDDYKAAIEDLSSCIKQSPNTAIYYYSRAYWLELSLKYGEAISDYERAIELNPKLFDAYFGMANCYRLEKNFEAACKSIDKAEQAGSQMALDVRQNYCKY